MLSTLKNNLLVLQKSYYCVNLIMSLSFITLRLVPPVCTYLFSTCELSWRETEILMFVAIIIAFRTKRAGTTSFVGYLGSMFTYLKGANVILFSYADFRMALIYIVLWIVQFLTLPEPVYKGPENIVYFNGPSLVEELESNHETIWFVTFYAAWSPSCVKLAPILSKISASYSLENLRFGKLDVTRYEDVAQKFGVSSSAYGRQLPTIIMYQNGKERLRVPTFDRNGKLLKFIFSEDNINAAFDLNNIYSECKSKLSKSAENYKKD